MDCYLDELGYNFWEKSVDLTDGLNRIIKCEILNEKDLIILNSGGLIIPEVQFKNSIDKCEFEDSVNQFHIDDYVADRISYNDLHYLGLGLEFTKQLTRRLENEFPQKHFRIILSFGKVKDTDVYEFGNCVARFYTIREEVEKTFKVDDLNSYEDEGIIEIEINN